MHLISGSVCLVINTSAALSSCIKKVTCDIIVVMPKNHSCTFLELGTVNLSARLPTEHHFISAGCRLTCEVPPALSTARVTDRAQQMTWILKKDPRKLLQPRASIS